MPPKTISPFTGLLFAFVSAATLHAAPVDTMDLNGIDTNEGVIFRLLGSGPANSGSAGVPVSGGFDMDGDGRNDFAMANFLSNPLGRTEAGQVFLVFGDNNAYGQIDTANPHVRVLRIYGDQDSEHAGSELWMADVTGDGLGDLLICRQDFSRPGRIGSGGLTIIPGQAQLRTMATNGDVLDLREPPPGLKVVDIHGANTGSRLCIWARTGDVTGDGIDDFAVGADQEASNSDTHSGAVYVFRGGSHFAISQTVDLQNFGTVVPGNVARIRPIDGGTHFHFGATVQVADLDDNGKAEVVMAAALNRAGASLAPLGGSGHASGGTPDGTLYIAWDDNFNGTWIPAPNTSLDFIINTGPGDYSRIDGRSGKNDAFGEEILGGLDYDNDGSPDLFVGDLTADGWDAITRTNAGTGHVIYDAAMLKGLDFDLNDSELPDGFVMSTFVGPTASAIGGDTAMHGDFSGDGIADLAFSSPHDDHFGRVNSGTIHVVLGRNGVWPALVDLAPANFPSSATVAIMEIYGANGSGVSGDAGDTLSYSGAFGDMNGDGSIEIITNEMEGNGTAPAAIDVGHLLLIDLRRHVLIFEDDFESP